MRIVACILLVFAINQLLGQNEELGDVKWERDFDKAIERSKNEKKDIFILFQEVPGCATCRNYGNNVLSHPLLVELIETEFIPLAIFNNKGGKDKAVLDYYKEPSWNNPVVRIIDEKKGNVVNRLAGDYSLVGVLELIKESLEHREAQVPVYLRLLLEEQDAMAKEACYSMYCFWSGEAHFGSENGIIGTESGFQNGKEVVRVTYDQKMWSQEKLNKYARQGNCHPEKDGSFRKDKEVKYYLHHHALRGIRMTPIQQTRVNAALKKGIDPLMFLSPRQKRHFADLQGRSLSQINNLISEPI